MGKPMIGSLGGSTKQREWWNPAAWVAGALAVLMLGAPASPLDGQETIARETVDSHVEYLASDALRGRDAFSPDIVTAENYIAGVFRSVGLSAFPDHPGYLDRFTYEYRPRRNPDAEPTNYSLQNVIGFLEGTDPELKNEFILFGAHHDHVGVRGEVGDSIYNGANDNAAGTTAVLALAEYFATRGGNKRSLIFTTFTAEERGLIGARHLASDLPIDPDQLVCMINFEMIGRPAEEGDWSLMYLGPEYSTLDEILLSATDQDAPVELVAPLEHQLRFFRMSDNAAFHAEGFISMTLTSPFSTEDPKTHRPEDEYGSLNVDYMTAVIRTVADVVAPLVSGEKTPQKTGG